MFVKKIQIYIVEIVENAFWSQIQVKKLNVDRFTIPRQNSLRGFYHHPLRKRQITHSPKLRGRAMETNYKIYYFKSTLKPITM